MTSQLNISLGVLKFIASDLDEQLDGANIADLRICRTENVVSVHSFQGLVTEYDVERVSLKLPMVDRPCIKSHEDSMSLTNS